MSNVFVGQIIQGGWNFAPRGFAMCNGALMSIQQNNALFALLGTSFGGNGQTNFGLPDLQGRAMVAAGQGAGLSPYTLGEKTGAESVTLLTANMPSHTHAATFTQGAGTALNAATTKANSQVPVSGGPLGRTVDGATGGTALPEIYCPAGTDATTPLAGLNVAGTVTVGPSGNNSPFSIVQPVLAVTIVIALNGIFPSRN